jgi:hypothetical protein
LSTPTGLSCTFLPETYAGVAATKDNEPHRLLVKQTYTARCDDKAGEHFKNFNSNVLKEKSRIIKSDGSVVKFMIDNSVEVYFHFNYFLCRKVVKLFCLKQDDFRFF